MIHPQTLIKMFNYNAELIQRQTAVLTHATRGEEAILGVDSHIYHWENGSIAAYGGVMPRPLPTDENGRMNLHQIEATIQPTDVHLGSTRLLSLF